MTQPRTVAGIHHTDTGAGGPPLVLLHGAGGTHLDWPEELRALPGRRVLAVDLPGHGGSPGPGCTSIGDYARSVLALLDALDVPSAVVAGHSMGGAVALTLALEAPARVAGLLLVGTGARLRVAPAILQATLDPAAYAQASAGMADFAFGPGASAALRQEHAERRKAQSLEVIHGDFVACDAFDVIPRLGELRTPALVVCGSEDRLTPRKYSEALRDKVAGARLEVVPGGGHMVMREFPAAVAAAVSAFLAR